MPLELHSLSDDHKSRSTARTLTDDEVPLEFNEDFKYQSVLNWGNDVRPVLVSVVLLGFDGDYNANVLHQKLRARYIRSANRNYQPENYPPPQDGQEIHPCYIESENGIDSFVLRVRFAQHSQYH